MIRLFVTFQNFKQGCHGPGVSCQKYYFIILVDCKIKVFEEKLSINSFAQSLYCKYTIAGFTAGSKNDTGIFTCRRLNLFNIQFFDHFFPACGLLRLLYICPETRNEFLKFLFLFLCFFVLGKLLPES